MNEYWDSLSTGKKVKFSATVFLVVFALTFAIVNWQEIELEFIFFRMKMYVTLLILICLIIGYLISTLVEYKQFKTKNEEIDRLKKEIEKLKEK